MGLDQTALQLAFNVVMITGATCLALTCHLLRRENEELTLKLRVREPEENHISTPRAEKAATRMLDRKPACMPPTIPRDRQDIRQFVARRSQEWNVRTAVKVG
jgi:hypothetical protein